MKEDKEINVLKLFAIEIIIFASITFLFAIRPNIFTWIEINLLHDTDLLVKFVPIGVIALAPATCCHKILFPDIDKPEQRELQKWDGYSELRATVIASFVVITLSALAYIIGVLGIGSFKEGYAALLIVTGLAVSAFTAATLFIAKLTIPSVATGGR